MSDENSNKKKNFFKGVKDAFKKVTTRKYTKKDLKKIWDVAKDTGSEIGEKPLRETGLLLTAAVVPGAGFAWVAYRLKRFQDRRKAANDNTPAVELTPEQKAAAEADAAAKQAKKKKFRCPRAKK